MRISKTNNVVFSSNYILKTKNSILLNFMEDANARIFSKETKPTCKYFHDASVKDKNGFFYGFFTDDLKSDFFKYNSFSSNNINSNKELVKEINSVDDLIKIPALKKFKQKLLNLFNNNFNF